MSERKQLHRVMYDASDAEQLQVALEKGRERYLPKKKEKKSMRNILLDKRSFIESLKEEGYTIEQISKMIIEGGFKVAESTLIRYVGEILRKKRSSTKTRVKKEKPQPTESPSSPESSARPAAPRRQYRAEEATFEVLPDQVNRR